MWGRSAESVPGPRGAQWSNGRFVNNLGDGVKAERDQRSEDTVRSESREEDDRLADGKGHAPSRPAEVPEPSRSSLSRSDDPTKAGSARTRHLARYTLLPRSRRLGLMLAAVPCGGTSRTDSASGRKTQGKYLPSVHPRTTPPCQRGSCCTPLAADPSASHASHCDRARVDRGPVVREELSGRQQSDAAPSVARRTSCCAWSGIVVTGSVTEGSRSWIPYKSACQVCATSKGFGHARAYLVLSGRRAAGSAASCNRGFAVVVSRFWILPETRCLRMETADQYVALQHERRSNHSCPLDPMVFGCRLARTCSISSSTKGTRYRGQKSLQV